MEVDFYKSNLKVYYFYFKKHEKWWFFRLKKLFYMKNKNNLEYFKTD